MADDEMGSRIGRAAGRALATPSRVQWLFANQESVNEGVRELLVAVGTVSARLDALEDIANAISVVDDNGRAGVAVVGEEIHRLRADLDHHLAALDAALAGHASVLQRAVATPARDAELARLLTEQGPAPATRQGLSVFTICWNHGGLLAASVASALAALDALPPEDRGEVLVLDDASSDETASVAAGLAATDPRIRVVTATANLGLARARNVLLHAATTTHAFQLDADNTAVPSGVTALLEVARRHGSAFTYGNVLRVDADGTPLGVISNEPLTASWLANNSIDTMAVVDVDRARALGGWPTDPVVEHVDDWAFVHRLARAGELIGFVPVVAGRYRALPSAFHLTVTDTRIGPDRVTRMFNPDGRLTAESIASFAAHPLVGPLWASTTAATRFPSTCPPKSAPVAAPTRPRLLVIGPGGVANLGDDAIVAAGLDQLRLHAPDHDLDLLTDGPAPTAMADGARWLGTLSEAVWGLGPDDLPAGNEEVAAALACVPGPPRGWSWRTIDPADYAGAVFLGGGTLTSLWPDTLVAPRAVLAAALGHAATPYVVTGQGIGPLDERDRHLVRTFAGAALAVGVRDPASATELGDVNADMVGDDALLLDRSGADLPSALAAAGVTGPYLAFTAREADYVGSTTDGLERWAAAVDAEAARRGISVLGVALNDQPPTTEAATLARLAHGGVARSAPWRVLACDGDPALLAAALAGADAVAAHSYHAALFGLQGGVPSVLAAASPYYAAKAAGLAALAGLDSSLAVPDGAEDELGDRLARVAAQLAGGAGLRPAEQAVDTWWQAAVARLLAVRASG